MRRLMFGVMAVLAMGSSCAMSLASVRRAQSAGHVGCSPEELSVQPTAAANWTADCRGTRYYCAVTGHGSVACTPALPTLGG